MATRLPVADTHAERHWCQDTASAAREREALAQLYDAGMGDLSWDHALDTIRTLVSATGVVLFAQQAPGTAVTVLGTIGVSADAQREYLEYYGARNVLLELGAPLQVPGVVRTNETICPDAILLASEFYNDYLRPHGTRHTLTITVWRDDVQTVHLSALRPAAAGPFDAASARTFSTLYPHVRQALRVARRLADRGGLVEALQEVGTKLSRGIALLDEHGRLVHASAAFERLCAERDGLVLDHGQIVAADHASRATLAELIDDARRGRPGGSMALARGLGMSPFSVLVSPVLASLPRLEGRTPRVSVIVTDPMTHVAPDVLHLQRQFGLTRAEARLVCRLVAGASVREIAEQLHVSVHTARTHLKHVLAKLGVSRQAELVRLILTGTGA